MRYLANASSPAIRAVMRSGGWLGQMCTPAEGRAPVPGAWFALDNGCYGQGWPGTESWWDWVVRHTGCAARCLFVTAPDVVADAAATLARSRPWLPRIRELGLAAALVAQDGLERRRVPWDSFDLMFVGGTTRWKLGAAAADLIGEARARGKSVHMGRVNSARRWFLAAERGVDSVDGTFLTYAPDTNLTRLRAWHTATHDAIQNATNDAPNGVVGAPVTECPPKRGCPPVVRASRVSAA